MPNRGNSGRPSFTGCGEMVGIVEFGLTNSPGLNFAIVAWIARPAIVTRRQPSDL
jgi:S1-C subfamily serine protease